MFVFGSPEICIRPGRIDLKRTGGFANDDDFVYHLLRSERDRQDRLDAE